MNYKDRRRFKERGTGGNYNFKKEDLKEEDQE